MNKYPLLAASIRQLSAAINKRLDDNLLKQKGPKVVVSEYITVTAGSTRQYDLHSLLEGDLAVYDLKTADITVRVKDTNPTSPLYNIYANAEAVVSYGITADESYVIIANQANVAVDLYVKVVITPTAED